MGYSINFPAEDMTVIIMEARILRDTKQESYFNLSIYLSMSIVVNEIYVERYNTLLKFRQNLSIYLSIYLCRGTLEVIVIVKPNETETWVQIVDEAVCILHRAKILGESMNPTTIK